MMYSIKGLVKTGLGKGKNFVGNQGYFSQIKAKFDIEAYHGTLNVESNKEDIRSIIKSKKKIILKEFSLGNKQFGSVICYEVRISKSGINDLVNGIIVIPQKTNHPNNILEIISEYNLRKRLNIKDNDKVDII